MTVVNMARKLLVP